MDQFKSLSRTKKNTRAGSLNLVAPLKQCLQDWEGNCTDDGGGGGTNSTVYDKPDTTNVFTQTQPISTPVKIVPVLNPAPTPIAVATVKQVDTTTPVEPVYVKQILPMGETVSTPVQPTALPTPVIKPAPVNFPVATNNEPTVDYPPVLQTDKIPVVEKNELPTTDSPDIVKTMQAPTSQPFPSSADPVNDGLADSVLEPNNLKKWFWAITGATAAIGFLLFKKPA